MGLNPTTPGLSVTFEPSGRKTEVTPGTTLMAAAHRARVSIVSSCGGYGTCGECRVRIIEGEAPVSETDRNHLTEAELGEGWRLACGLEVSSDLTFSVPAADPQPQAAVEGVPRPITVDPRPGHFGLAFDLGTTTAAGVLIDLSDGRVLAADSQVNAQTARGADVISRAAFTRSQTGGTEELQRLALDTLNSLVEDLCQKAGVAADAVYEAVVTGNAIMLHLLLGMDPHPLAVAPFRPAFFESQDVEAAGLVRINPRGRIVTFPIISAYAGGDTVAGIHAVDLAGSDSPSLLIDLGTNTEVALGWMGRVVAASAPAGPAFEGAGVRWGSPAIPGAIAHVRADAQVDLEVIGEGKPTGICGSGLVDILAELRRTGLLDSSGRLAARGDVPEHPLAQHLEKADGTTAFRIADGIHLEQSDIRELQSAIAAVRSAVQIALDHAQLKGMELGRVFLAGSFGGSLNPRNAQVIGLVPSLPEERVQGVGNAAMEGAKAALVSLQERQASFRIPDSVEYLELSGHPGFNDAFLESLTFPPI